MHSGRGGGGGGWGGVLSIHLSTITLCDQSYWVVGQGP
jgi:hypothetical protein